MEREQEQRLRAVTLEPLDDWLVVEPVGRARRGRAAASSSPVGADQACRSGIVDAVDSDAAGVELGDKILFPKDAGYEVRVGSGSVKLLREHVIAHIHD